MKRSDPIKSPRNNAEQLLQRSLGNPNARFREGQWESIDALVNDRSRVLVVQRTGWGKSMVYFLATRILRDQGRGPTLIISPLLALMRNQVMAARRINLNARAINSSTYRQWDTIEKDLYGNTVDLLLVSPERLAKERFQSKVVQLVSFGLIVVDEAHCISDWGHDFRPDYRRIIALLKQLPPNLPVVGTTATANDRVVNDIKQQLGNIIVKRGKLTRESLELQAIIIPDQASRMAWLAEQIPNLNGTGIVYVLTKRDAISVEKWLKSVGINACSYYAGMVDNEFKNSDDYRRHIEDLFLENKVKVLVATTALGMGYDKPDVGFVIHYQTPGSVIAYYQQVGRAGRALPKAAGVLLSGEEDAEIIEFFRDTAFPSEDIVDRFLAFVRGRDGVKESEIESELNLSQKQIEQIIKYLSVQTQSPIVEIDGKWRGTPVHFTMDKSAIQRLSQQREAEWKQIQGYIRTKDCRMAFLQRALNDSDIQDCGCCENCTGRFPVNPEFSEKLMLQTLDFLKKSEFPIKPLRKIPTGACPGYGLFGSVQYHLVASEGRVLSRWADAGWGGLVKEGKNAGYFDDQLVEAVAEMITVRWHPAPFPKWMTCIPSARNPVLVRSFSERLAAKMRLPFIEALIVTGSSEPQKQQRNPFRQFNNLDGAFRIGNTSIPSDPVFLIDDTVDSGATFTIAAALLRYSGSGNVYPVALTSTANS